MPNSEKDKGKIVVEVINGNGKKAVSQFTHTIDPADLEDISFKEGVATLRFTGTTIKIPGFVCTEVHEAHRKKE